jgi:hypothetical protein
MNLTCPTGKSVSLFFAAEASLPVFRAGIRTRQKSDFASHFNPVGGIETKTGEFFSF